MPQQFERFETMGDLVLLYLVHLGIGLTLVFENRIPSWSRQREPSVLRSIKTVPKWARPRLGTILPYESVSADTE